MKENDERRSSSRGPPRQCGSCSKPNPLPLDPQSPDPFPMYKLLLCWRYLCTRYIALASIISVTLGVAVMIVVNSVMSGFATEYQGRIHGILSDVVVDARSMEGVPDAEWHKEQIRKVAGDQIEGMTATVVVPAMLSFRTAAPGSRGRCS